MKILSVFLFFLLITGQAFSQQREYYVTVKNDTVPLGDRDFIDVHTHPQLLWVKKDGKKKAILPDSVVYLQQDRSYLNGKFRNVTVLDKYIMLDVAMSNGKTCRHYAREVFRLGNVAIMETPFCSQCRYLELYLSENGKFVATLNKDNFKNLVAQYFSACPQLVEYSRQKKYWSGKFHRFLTKTLKCSQ